MSAARDDPRAGFTLIEVLVVMAISALVLSVVVHARPRAADLRLGVQARGIVSALRTRRAEALTTATETTFAFDPVARGFDPPGVAPALPVDMAVEMLMSDAERRGRDGVIRFYPDGRSSGGAIALSLEGRRMRVDVDWLTGAPWIR